MNVHLRVRNTGRLLLWALLAAGCGRSAAVQSTPTLALRRVVVYRNGVGYFERQGRVTEEEVEFRVRQAEVGDFLATLAVMERGGSSVRSAAFPMPDEPPHGDDARPAPTERRRVRLELDGRDHDLVVGYMVETPIWRPSYRLVFMGEGDGVQVQAWGIVQNLSGEDWRNVRLSLVAGAPVSFRSQLAEAMITPRPLVTDRGELIESVPVGQTTLAQTESPPPPPPAAAPTPEPAEPEAANAADDEEGGGGGRRITRERARRAPTPRPSTRLGGPMPVQQRYGDAFGGEGQGAVTGGYAGPSAPRNVAALAAVAVQGGVTRYDLPRPVTVPDRSATMVMLASRDVPGERIYLFAPDPGVAESASHPFQVARFENRTGAMLERGPLAIFESGAFLGQGMLEPLPDGASATVPFALERALAVTHADTYAVEGARLLRVARGEITVERYRVTRTTYRLRNGMDRQVRVMVRHGLPGETRLFEPPQGTEEANGAALVPVSVNARGSAEQVVTGRVPFSVRIDWTNEFVPEALEGYLRDGRAEPAIATTLRSALDMRRQIIDLSHERDDQERRRSELRTNAEETRENLEAIRRNPNAADLRNQLTARLAQMATQVDQATRRIVELDTQVSERRVRLTEIVRALEVDATATPAPASTAPATPPATPPTTAAPPAAPSPRGAPRR